MIYPINHISITQGYHSGKCLDFGYFDTKYLTQPILACDSGIVYKVEKQSKGGNVIYIRHEKFISCYAHLSKVNVKIGQSVKLGEQIGNMGSTGVVTGPHLHFGLYSIGKNIYGNSDIDPFNYLEVYKFQEVATKTQSNYKNKIKYHEEFVEGVYLTLKEKYIRTNPYVGNNRVLYKNLYNDVKPKCNKDTFGYAKFKVGVEIELHEFTTDIYGNLWGKLRNTWICVKDSTGPQVKKV